MNDWIYVAILGVVQGLTEFLPVSSSGHLALLGKIFNFSADKSLSLGIVLHAGSLAAIILFYFKLIIKFFSFSKERIKLALMLLLASVPAGVVGVIFKLTNFAEELFGNMIVVAICFMISATILRISSKEKLIIKPKNEENSQPTQLEKISVKQSLAIGFSQMFAILPGVSRSGSTISAGILANVERESAAAFSFLMAIIAISGALLLELRSLFSGESSNLDISISQLVFGFFVSAIVSLGALCFLVKLIKKGKFAQFSWYLYLLGIGILIWQVIENV